MTVEQRLSSDILRETGVEPISVNINEAGITVSFLRDNVRAANITEWQLSKGKKPIGCNCPLSTDRDFQGDTIVIFAR